MKAAQVDQSLYQKFVTEQQRLVFLRQKKTIEAY